MRTTLEVISTSQVALEVQNVDQLNRLLIGVLKDRVGLDPQSVAYGHTLAAERRLRAAIREAERRQVLEQGLGDLSM